jgi:CHAT domain-containing protein
MPAAVARAALALLVLLVVLRPSVAAAEAAPPRSIADITAILDAEHPDPAKVAARTQAADAGPPAALDELALARFFAERSRAAAALGRITQALDDLRRALDIARRHQADQPALVVQYLDGLRSLESRFADIPAAMATSRQILELTRRHPAGHTFLAYQTLITDLAQNGRLDEAEALLRELGPLVRERSASPAAASYRAGFAWCLDRSHDVVALVSGRYEEAVAAAGAAVADGEAAAAAALPGSPYAALSWSSAGSYSQREQALAYLNLGRLAEAEIAVRQALLRELKGHGRYAVETVDMIATLGTVLAAEGRYAEAEHLERIAIDTYLALKVEAGSRALANARAALVSTLVGQHRWSEGLAEVDRIRDALAGDPVYLRHLFRLNWTFIATAIWGGRPQDGVTWAKQALEDTAEVLGPDHYRTAFQTAMYADALAAAGDLAGARAGFAKAMPVLLASGGQGTDETGQARLDRWRTVVLDGYLAVLAADGSADAAGEAFRIADAARGQTVQRAVAAAAARAAVRDPANADLIRREQDSRRRIDALTNLLAAGYALPSGQRDDAALTRLRAEIDRATSDHAGLRAEIARRIPDYARLIDPRPATVADAQAALHPGEALVAVYVSVRRTYSWAVPKAGPIAFASSPLSRGEVNQAVAQLRKALDPDAETAGDIPAFDVGTAHRLYAGLLEPVRSGWQGARTLLVVANGALGEVPFGLLVTADVPVPQERDGQPLFAGYRTVPWLIRQVAIADLPSVTALTTLRAAPPPAAGRRPFLGFGDPWFSPAEADEAKQEAMAPPAATAVAMRKAPVRLRSVPRTEDAGSAGLADLPRLPETADEVRAAAVSLKADPARDVFLGSQASEQRVRSMRLDDRRVIMFATHGLVPGDLDGLGEPALALSAPALAGGGGDGLLTVSKILDLRLDADWVVLSACNTAAGNGAGAEAVSGLGQAFFYAGTRALLVSNWPVETGSARLLTTRLFRHEAEDPGLSRAEALRRTMLELLDGPGMVDPATGRTLFSYAHPIFWAPFSLVGDAGAG